MFVIKPITAFPCCSFSFGKISGNTPDMAGHQSAFSTPKSAPIKANNQTDGKPAINAIALTAVKTEPIMSTVPTIRFRLKRSPITPPNNINAISGTKRAAITKLKSLPSAPGILSTP